jgi:hypothetical protein
VNEQKNHTYRLKCYAYLPKVTFKKLGDQVECTYCKKLHLVTMNLQGIPFWKPQKGTRTRSNNTGIPNS